MQYPAARRGGQGRGAAPRRCAAGSRARPGWATPRRAGGLYNITNTTINNTNNTDNHNHTTTK